MGRRPSSKFWRRSRMGCPRTPIAKTKTMTNIPQATPETWASPRDNGPTRAHDSAGAGNYGRSASRPVATRRRENGPHWRTLRELASIWGPIGGIPGQRGGRETDMVHIQTPEERTVSEIDRWDLNNLEAERQRRARGVVDWLRQQSQP